MSLHGTSLLSVWKFLPQPSFQALPALAHQRSGSFLLYSLTSAPLPSLLQTHCSALMGHVPSNDRGNFVTTHTRSCLSKFLGLSKRKQPQLIRNHPKSPGSPFTGGERLGVRVLPSCPSFLASQITWTRFPPFEIMRALISIARITPF